MSEYKLVPVEPTAEMMATGGIEMGARDEDARTVWTAMLNVSPDVQGEPSLVVWVLYDATADKKYIKASDDGSLAIFDSEAAARRARAMSQGTDYKRCEYYTAPQPAEQQPSAGDSLASVPDEVFAAEFAAWWDEHGQFCRAGGGTYERTFAFEAWRHLYPQLMNLQMAATEQKPAPDVAGLVEALDRIAKLPMNPCSTENDYRLSAAKAIASAAISDHRKQGGEV